MAALTQIKDIRIFAKIHAGATTLVYKGYQQSLERFVLLKVLRPEFKVHEDLVRRFENEAKLVANVRHPNVVTVFDYGEHEDWIYFATEYIDGYNLEDLIKQRQLPPEVAWFVLMNAASGLKAAHDQNIVHQDIKPSNILVSHDAWVKLADFGTATMRQPNGNIDATGGTLAYFAPERILGEELNGCSDLFSLGATFYKMLSGVQPFNGQTNNDLFNEILDKDPIYFLQKDAALPAELIRICRKMLMKSPGQRYQNCDELIADLHNFENHYGLAASDKELRNFMAGPKAYHSKLLAHELQKTLVSSQSTRGKDSKKAGNKYVLRLALAAVFLLVVGYLTISNRKDDTLRREILLTELQPAFVQTDSDLIEDESIGKGEPLDTLPDDNSPGKPDAPRVAIAESQAQKEPEEPKQTEETSARYLEIVCVPWADVFINSDFIGRTPLKEFVSLTAGRYEIVLKNPDFPEYKASIEVTDPELTSFEFSFWSLVGTVRVEVSPWADVYVDGEKRFTTPQKKPLLLLPGNHLLKLEHPALGEWETTIEVVAHTDLNLKYNLRNLVSE